MIDALAVHKDADGGVQVFSDEQAWDVLEDIPNDSAAALILIEHHWAVPLRDAIARAGRCRNHAVTVTVTRTWRHQP